MFPMPPPETFWTKFLKIFNYSMFLISTLIWCHGVNFHFWTVDMITCPEHNFGNLEEFAYQIEMIQTLASHSNFFSALAINSIVPRFPAESSLFSLLSSPLLPHPCSHLFVFFILVHFQTVYSLSFLDFGLKKRDLQPCCYF